MHLDQLIQRAFASVLATVAPVAVHAADLNDTGVTQCTDGVSLGLTCATASDGTAQLMGQDAEHGRDLTHPDPADGIGGFSFTRLDVSGVALADQQADYAAMPWACVRDEVTGLVWEVKTDDAGVRSQDWTYSWFDSSGDGDGGFPGTENGGTCADETHCDTEKYIAQINDNVLCGFSNWRLPDWNELHSILAYPNTPTEFPLVAAVDLGYFPNTVAANYWTQTSSVLGGTTARVIFFGGGGGFSEGKSSALAVRLVRREVQQ